MPASVGTRVRGNVIFFERALRGDILESIGICKPPPVITVRRIDTGNTSAIDMTSSSTHLPEYK
jgi:hypothetical protein